MTWPFECVTIDQLLVRIATKITRGARELTGGKYYFCVNSEGSGSSGDHWVSCVLDIRFGDVEVPHLASSQGSLHGTDTEDLQRGTMTEDDSCGRASSDGDFESDGSDESFELQPKQIRFSFGGEDPATHVHAGGIGKAENLISDD